MRYACATHHAEAEDAGAFSDGFGREKERTGFPSQRKAVRERKELPMKGMAPARVEKAREATMRRGHARFLGKMRVVRSR